MNLTIELSKNNPEIVSNHVIEKLYEIAIDTGEPRLGNPDSIYLSGYIKTDKTYEEYVKYLAGRIGFLGTEENNSSGRFQDLLIDVTSDYYVPFVDSEFKRIILSTYNNGNPMTILEIASISSDNFFSLFTENTTLVDASDFKYFTGLHASMPSTSIPGVFRYCTNLVKVELPNLIENMRYDYYNNNCGWFRGCTKLTTVRLSNNLVDTGKLTFEGCTSLKTIDLSNTKVTSLGENCFLNSGLETIIFSSGYALTRIENGALINTKLTSFTFPGTLTYLGESVLTNCKNLTEVIYEEGNSHSGIDTCWGCSNLQSVSLPSSLKTLHGGCFGNCSNLLLSTNDLLYIETIGGNRDRWIFRDFNNWDIYSNITSSYLNLPNLKLLGFGGFARLRNITKVNFPNLIYLHAGAVFHGCPNLVEVESLGKITTIDYSDTDYGVRAGMFLDCTSLTTVNLPETLSILSNSMFDSCSALTTLNIPFSINFVDSGCFRKTNALLNKILYFPNVEKIGAVLTFANNANMHIYLPKLKDFKGITANSYVNSRPYYDYGLASMFVQQRDGAIHWGYCITNVMYFKDITYFPAALFAGCNIKAVIINNTTVPTLEASTIANIINDSHNYNDTIFAGFATIGAIYVPDSVITDYTNSPLFADVIDKIKPLSQCPRITTAQAEAGLTGLIEEYM